MKKFIKPNFEFIFSVALIAILGLPPLVLAQTQKSIEIQIVNGDTTINGKNIKKLSAQERKDALAEMANLPQTPMLNNDGSKGNNRIFIKRKSIGDGKQDIVIERSTDSDGPIIADFDGTDSARKDVRVRLKKLKGTDSVQAFTYRFDNELPAMDMKTFSFNMPRLKQGFEFNSRNTQTFTYSNTDNDGINTHISFRVSDPSKEKIKRVAGTDKAALMLDDINLTPEFSTGKTTLSFNLPAKIAADVKFTDTEGRVLWTDKAASGTFSKKISLPLNGVYYLQVKQGANVAVKKIVKE
ncbi:T9SS type A sorting domain-containing protein [Mucilaginibacter terrigena]|uniref:T9SS type A sorting domain-containing protein n=1 Tax=Mucilaginibacter terrigena TaxID=2492395 RepID=A0A4Q5LGU0_9SPHI|nr:T9SS type A sorting domain-containing protein [Mucilaginibacter terrigena]RYU86190.1 T9SS type A sorting domain-containing protein [Mucilaginibacter terrigena]